MSAIEKYQPNISEIQTWAEKFAESGMFTDARQVVQAFVKISAGAELGLTPFQSMSGVHIIQGKPVVGAGLLASLLDRDPAYDYRVEWEPDEKNPQACTVIVIKNGNERGRSRFSLEDAKRAGLTQPNWAKYPASMLFARAMSNAVRWYAPGATGTSVYVEGELDPTPAAPQPNGVTAKPRTRVTAEVIRNEPEEHVDGEIEYEPVTMPPVGKQLRTLGAMERTDLYRLCGVTTKLTPEEAHALFTAKADELGLPFSDPPNIHAILSRARHLEHENLPDDSAEAFQHFADTGQDLADDPQTALT